jgi:hypothetical protein
VSETQQKFLLPGLLAFISISSFWLFFKVPYYQYIYLFLGLGVGTYFLDLDHIVYWLYLNPNTDESRLAKTAIFKYDFRSIFKLISATQHQHTNLIFHHFFFQVVISIISFFVFSSSSNVFGNSLLFAINIHLLVHEFDDYKNRKAHLQDWLFAREQKQLPIDYLGKYIALFTCLNIVFFILLIRSAT